MTAQPVPGCPVPGRRCPEMGRLFEVQNALSRCCRKNGVVRTAIVVGILGTVALLGGCSSASAPSPSSVACSCAYVPATTPTTMGPAPCHCPIPKTNGNGDGLGNDGNSNGQGDDQQASHDPFTPRRPGSNPLTGR